jgi:hypothetical protein
VEVDRGNDGLWKAWENEKLFSHPSHSPWKSMQLISTFPPPRLRRDIYEKIPKRSHPRCPPQTDSFRLILGLEKTMLKRYTVSDGRGLFLDITPNGSMSWVFRYRLNGKQEKINIGPYPVLSLKDAREKRDVLAVSAAKGISPAEEKRKLRAVSTTQSAGDLTVRAFGERYLNEQVDKNWKDPSNERRYLEKEFFPEFGAGL